MTKKSIRPSGRKHNEIRKIKIKRNFIKNADGSCLISFGNTSIICSASIENNIPSWLKGSGHGWLTAEYSMLPTSTHKRNERESIKGKLKGRTQEIQRLIGRSLRASINLKNIGEKQIKIDCDVINADGGTRTASITGAWVALKIAMESYLKSGFIKSDPIIYQIAAISCGIYKGKEIIDLDYKEDNYAETDANFVLTKSKKLLEIQATAEKKPMNKNQIEKMINIATKETKNIFLIQDKCINNEK
tara:strand:+ start:10721 stop:11458 length:738 start_codon:yes stop_codon:yes gene_type:complete